MESTPRSLPGGPDNGRAPIQPEPSPMNCDCDQCRITAIHGRLLRLAVDAPRPIFERLAELAMSLGEHLGRGCRRPCLSLEQIRGRIEQEAVSVSDFELGTGLRGIVGDLNNLISKGSQK